MSFWCTDYVVLGCLDEDAGKQWVLERSVEKSGPGPVPRGDLGVGRGGSFGEKWKSPNRIG